MPTSRLSCFSVFDNKELFYSTSPEKDLRLTSHLWTNNGGLIAIVNDYFDRIWLNSKQVSVEEGK